MKIDGKHVLLFFAISLLISATVVGIVATNLGSSGSTSTSSGVNSLGEEGESETLTGNVKLEEGDGNVIIDYDLGNNSLTFSLGYAWQQLYLGLENFRLGSTPPTATTRGAWCGYEFDAAAENLTVEFGVPTDWDQATNPYFIVGCILLNNESTDDLLDFDLSVNIASLYDDVDLVTPISLDIDQSIGSQTNPGVVHYLYTELDFVGNSVVPSDTVSINIKRSTNIGTGGYVADVMVFSSLVFYYSASIGGAFPGFPSP